MNRRFYLSDFMALVVAVGVGIAWTRALYGDSLDVTWDFFRSKPLKTAHFVMLLSYPLHSALSVTILVLRLRRPRPDRTRLARQPGFVACALAAAGSALLLLIIRGIRSHLISIDINSTEDDIIQKASYFCWVWIGSAVAGAWACLWLGRRWRPERSWVDRAGRAMGLLWIAYPGLFLVAFLWVP